MPAPLYARWVPPKPSFQRQPSPVSPRTESSPTHVEAKKSRKSKKRPKHGAKQATEQPNDPEELADPEAMETDHGVTESPKSLRKPKKRKRESVVEDQDDAADTALKKHKTILSKFEKVSKKAQEKAQNPQDSKDRAEGEREDRPQAVLHDLEPLPQPAPVPDPTFVPTFSILPPWLDKPTIVEASKRVPFDELGVQPFFMKTLEKRGYKEALAVQSALLPMLHPGFEQHLGDICVSAKTGSGKTLAYLLPIVEALRDRATPTLSALIVVPTRQLVDQALRATEELCVGTKLKVGTAVGSVPLATEQKQLVRLRAQYDPERAQILHKRASQQWETGFGTRGGIMEDLMTMPIDHVPQYDTTMDILICTPGRLVEHVESTTGFLLRSVRWLVIDEADQLLNQNFQGWAKVLMDALHQETPEDLMDDQERLRKQIQGSAWPIMMPTRRQITKVILSATMEKDLTKLGTLRLSRPKLVSVHEEVGEEQPAMADGDTFELPSGLHEFAVPVREGQKKPLYLLYLLLNYAFPNPDDQDHSSTIENLPNPTETRSIANHNSRVLVFTKSNESASRLSHLLSVLEPSLKDCLQTMTPSSTAKASKKLLRSFGAGDTKILIASDAASRGLDIPDISHVINYDMPSNLISYVHRVGRTARANKTGETWTLFTKTEAAWFWKQVAKGDRIQRSGKVKRVEWKEWNVTYNRKRTYDAALAELQEAVEGADSAE